MSNPVSPPEIRAIIAEEMRRLSVNLNANYKLPQRRPIVEVIASTFPLPSPPVLPELPWGCVLWGPDAEGFYEYRNAAGTFYYTGGKWIPVTVQTGTGTLDFIRSRFPTSPPPDWKEPTPSPADDWRERCRVYSTNQGHTWHVECTDRLYNLNGNHNRWQTGQFFYHNETQARAALAKAPPYPGYTPPLPAKVAGDGTVGPEYVRDNAGEYKRDGLVNPYRSDGRGSVRLMDGEKDCGPWAGVAEHIRTRFHPLPPKDNKCESSSSCGAGNMQPSQSSSSFASSSAESPNPSEPVAGGERVYHNQQRQQAEAWQAVVNALNFNFPAWLRWEGKNAKESAVIAIEECRLALSQGREREADLRTENARLQSELAGVRERVEKMERALRTIRSDCGTLSPQEFCNVCTDGLGLARAPYEGAADPNESCITLTSKIRDMRDRAVAASLSSRPLAPAEVSRG